MANPSRDSLATAAGILLFATGGVHAFGYAPLSQALQKAGMGAPWGSGILGLWVIYSAHLFILGSFVVRASAKTNESWHRVVINMATGFALADLALLSAYVGLFIGTVMLAVVSALLVASIVRRPRAGGPAAA